MPIATLKFTLPEERAEYEITNRAMAMSIAIEQVGNEIFRPARKHGYSEPELAALFEKCGDAGAELIYALEQRYYEILNENRALGD